MIATITNFGENLGIQFPKSLMKNVHISENDDVDIHVKNNSIILQRRETKKHLTTKERISNFFGSVDNIQVSETDWGKP